MKKKILSIPEILFSVFSFFAKDSQVRKSGEYYLVDVELDKMVIGLGIKSDHSKLVICRIKTDVHYEVYDERKYRIAYELGIPSEGGREPYWQVESHKEALRARPSDLLHLVLFMETSSQFMRMIYIRSQTVIDIYCEEIVNKKLSVLAE